MKAESYAIGYTHFHNSYNPTISISTLYNPLYIRIHIYITYTYNNTVLVLMSSLMFVVLIFQRSIRLLFHSHHRCHCCCYQYIRACQNFIQLAVFLSRPLARLKILQKIWGLARNIYRNEIVTKYNLLFDIMTLTFCNNHCQHLFICEIYNVNLNESNYHYAT